MYFIQFFMVVMDLDCFEGRRESPGGWLHEDAPIDWKQVDWSEMFASASPHGKW